ncbi:PKD domain-containing protein [Polluticoccus soli]|uniref:PKD domain-containing protein n=1 Tax=Polluticoccus soli TaxID=3034150 RepID=UPI0023E0C880|nr:PKD domain-containing protein [Flavipsychrobacter sp. JY13-12]
MKRTLTPALVFVFLICNLSLVSAQSWQWGKRGGGNATGTNQTPEDNVMDMATDRNGNVYILSIVETLGNEDIDGQFVNGFGTKDVLLSSFNCNGVLRWKKIFGGPSSEVLSGFNHSVRTDTTGHVYVVGDIYPSGGTSGFDTDTILPAGYKKNRYLVQYDTSGNFNWLRMPQPDTMSGGTSNRYRSVDLDVDNAGNVYWLCIMDKCQIAGTSQSIPSQGPYVLKYDVNGSFLGYTTLQMQAGGLLQSNFKCRLERDNSNGRFYLAGQYESGQLIISTQIVNSCYVGAFDAAGNLLWKKENSLLSNGFSGRPQIDAQGNIYLLGQSRGGDNFNGTAINNPLGLGAFPFIVKLDANGNNIWLKSSATDAATFCGGIALKNNNEVAISGSYPRRLYWVGMDSLENPTNTGYDIFVARFNAQTGAMLRLDSLDSPTGYDDHSSALVADSKGNYYIGGSFAAQLTVNSNVLNNSGGPTDFFIAKYGSANCTCTAPVSSYTFNAPANSAIAAFTYNGTSPYDSLRWDFGDGGTSTSATPTHTYASTGTYNVCVTVYNPCGSDTKCQTVSVTVGIDEVQVLDEITIYPNPVSNKLTINGAAGATAELYNVMGSKVYSGKLSVDNAEISTASLPAGSYILQLTTADGHRKTIKLAKE